MPDLNAPSAAVMDSAAASPCQLAQLNIAHLKAPLDSPQLADFVANLDRINALAEQTPGFVWRLQTDDGDATALRPLGDTTLVNMSVWDGIEALRQYVYRSDHAALLRRRWDWFEPMPEAAMVLWWVPAGHQPTVAEAIERLTLLRRDGPGPQAFSFKQAFDENGQIWTPVSAKGEVGASAEGGTQANAAPSAVPAAESTAVSVAVSTEGSARPQLARIHHAAIIASDYARSRRFYVEVLGLTVLAEHYRDARDSWKLDLGLPDGGQVELFSFAAPPKRLSYPEACGLRHLAFEVADLQAWVDYLGVQGVPVEPIRVDEYTQQRFVFFADPDGLPLELYECV